MSDLVGNQKVGFLMKRLKYNGVGGGSKLHGRGSLIQMLLCIDVVNECVVWVAFG